MQVGLNYDGPVTIIIDSKTDYKPSNFMELKESGKVDRMDKYLGFVILMN